MKEVNEMSWVNEDEILELSKAMATKYQIYLQGRWFDIECAQDQGAIYVTTTLRNKDESFVYPVEARVLAQEEGLKAREAALFLVDYIDAYFEDYLGCGEELYLPIDWQNMNYDAVSFQMRGQILNLKVERMADRLLEVVE